MAIVKIYGELIATYKKNSESGNVGLMDRTLEIYKTKTGLKGVLWKSNHKGWKENSNNIMEKSFIKGNDNDDLISFLLKDFGFTEENLCS